MPFLQFKGKTAVENHHHTVPHHTLNFDKKLSCLAKGEEPSLDGNLIIEGDNLLALKALLPTHAGKIKCIYIDPPYNTGNEGWIYNDNLTQPQFKEWIGKEVGKEGEDACRHDKWCCMMYPRLQLPKELLREDGSIWISIADHEIHNLRSLMNEIFGEENFVGCVVWEKTYTPKSNGRVISTDHDYVLVYCRSQSFIETGWNLLGRSAEQLARYSNPDNDPRGDWRTYPMDVRTEDTKKREKYRYPITLPSGRVVKPGRGRHWALPKKKFESEREAGRIYFGKTGDARPTTRAYLSEVREGVLARTWWSYKEVGGNQDAKKTLIEVLNTDAEFLTPKPVSLVQRILQIATRADDLVLDSFAGSGTTAHAVMAQNAFDSGDRQFILVQQPFDRKDDERDRFNLCRNMTAERIRRVISGYDFDGTKREILFETKVTMREIENADVLVKKIEGVAQSGAKSYDSIRKECKNGVVRVIGETLIKDKTPGLGGSFTYARLSAKPLFGEYKDFGDGELPSYEDIAKYVFYTETNHQWLGSDRRKNKAYDKKIGRIGEHPAGKGGRSYYLLYKPNRKYDWGIDIEFLNNIASKDPNHELVVYCEKVWVHRDQLRQFEREHKKKLRHMLVPFNLK